LKKSGIISNYSTLIKSANYRINIQFRSKLLLGSFKEGEKEEKKAKKGIRSQAFDNSILQDNEKENNIDNKKELSKKTKKKV